MNTTQPTTSPTLFGHPTGLFTLFFAEMWERFSYYGMRALLLLYMLKGFLGYADKEAYAVYGAYTALVYMTPFFGGMLADRLLGARRAVIVGGLLMAAGHLVMGIQDSNAFFFALALLICGNGFFKPNISSIVGTLYPEGSSRRDGGFTIFYMGVNLGAAMSPLLCGYIGETYGWHYGFGLATIGMLIGVAVFVAPTVLTQLLIAAGALAAAIGLLCLQPDSTIALVFNAFVAISLFVSGVVAVIALQRGGLPKEAGGAPDPEELRKPLIGPISKEWAVYIGTFVAVFVFALLVSGFAPLNGGEPVKLIPESVIHNLEEGGLFMRISSKFLAELAGPAGIVLMLAGLVALVFLGRETFRLSKVGRERMFVVLILTFFSMLFWSLFEQAGSSLNNFTDRNIDRVTEDRVIDESEVGTVIRFRIPFSTDDETLAALPLLSQEQLGHASGGDELKTKIADAMRLVERKKLGLKEGDTIASEDAQEIEEEILGINSNAEFTMSGLSALRSAAGEANVPETFKTVDWTITESNVGMGIGMTEIPASIFQACNPIYIIVFGLIFSTLWSTLGKYNMDPNPAIKFSLGLFQLGLGFAAFWYGAQTADPRGMVLVIWLLLGYLLHTTGELCLSPVGLSMITKLSPTRLVSTVMGAWFLATAIALLFASAIAQCTGATTDVAAGIPVPSETVNAFGSVYGGVAIVAIGSGLICLSISPILKRWMHEGVPHTDDIPHDDVH